MDVEVWSQEQWGQAQLGDTRRNDRAVKIASALLDKPSASFPEQCSSWAALKAAYRFFNEEDVSFEALQRPHRSLVVQKAKQCQVTLFIQDGSELDYSSHDIELGPIGNHHGHGLCLHTTLGVSVKGQHQEVLGIANQVLWERPRIRGKETRAQRRARPNEADVWANSVKAIGSAPEECLWVNVGDRAADIFEFIETCRSNNQEVVIRVVQNRNIFIEGQKGKVMELLKQRASKGSFELARRGRDGKSGTIHQLQLSWMEVEIQPPQHIDKSVKPCKGTYIRVWEDKMDGLEWNLFSSLPITTLEEALEKVKWYSLRWMIEEYHKCLKTGCGIEKRNLRNGRALQSVMGMFGIIAVKLLELKYLIKEQGTRLAKDAITSDLIGIISRRYKIEGEGMTIKTFWHNVAKLGGFIGRKSDGDPGWQTLWRGWVKLLTMQEALDDLQKCG